MCDEPALTIEFVCAWVSDAVVLFIGTIQQGSTTGCHFLSRLVDIGARDLACTPIHGLVVGILTAATEVKAHKQIIIILVVENERRLHRIHPSLRPARDRRRLGLRRTKIILRQFHELDAVPERTENQIWAPRVVHNKVGVDGVPVGASGV